VSENSGYSSPMSDTTHDALFGRLVFAIENTRWVARREEAGITVSSGRPVFSAGEVPHPAEGFYICSVRGDQSIDDGFSYFKDACTFADSANEMTSASEIISVLADTPVYYEAIVRTGFQLPWPLQDREFLHRVVARRDTDPDGRPRVLVAYDNVSEDGLPPAWDGYRRCPMAPSGQRLTVLADGQLRAEHCMTYDLGGWIGPAVQNTVFHRGHVGAYFDEWRAAMDALASSTLVSAAL